MDLIMVKKWFNVKVLGPVLAGVVGITSAIGCCEDTEWNYPPLTEEIRSEIVEEALNLIETDAQIVSDSADCPPEDESERPCVEFNGSPRRMIYYLTEEAGFSSSLGDLSVVLLSSERMEEARLY